MDTTYKLKLAILGVCLLCLIVGILIGHLVSYFTLRSKLQREEYLFTLRAKNYNDTITIIREAAQGPGIPGTEGRQPLYPTELQLPIPPTKGAHRMPAQSPLARKWQFPLGTPDPSAQTLMWGKLSVAPVSPEG